MRPSQRSIPVHMGKKLIYANLMLTGNYELRLRRTETSGDPLLARRMQAERRKSTISMSEQELYIAEYGELCYPNMVSKVNTNSENKSQK